MASPRLRRTDAPPKGNAASQRPGAWIARLDGHIEQLCPLVRGPAICLCGTTTTTNNNTHLSVFFDKDSSFSCVRSPPSRSSQEDRDNGARAGGSPARDEGAL
jgi:hypothetical protein